MSLCGGRNDPKIVIIDLRVYTTQFGENLMKAYESWRQLPATERGDLRVRRSVPTDKRSDREIFQEMELGDLWLESSVHEVFLYLFECKHLQKLY